LAIAVVLVRYLLKAREEKQKYRLFALRDRLIYLVAKGSLSEGSLLFKVFSTAINRSIGETSELTVFSLVNASLSAKTALQKEKQENIRGAIARSNDEVRAFVDDFSEVMMAIVLSNSPSLYATLLVVRKCGKAIKTIKSFAATPQRLWQKYDTYRYFEQMHEFAHTA
jgi:nitrogen fixation/metabolism regulation signal transduction histidine kinase